MTEFCCVNKDKFDEVYAWSYTDYMNMELEEFIPIQNIHRRFKEREMSRIVKTQQREWRAYKKALKRGHPATPGKEVCFIMDDCAFDGSIWKSEIMNEIFYNGRHAHITFVFVTQDAGDLPKHLRGQVDVAFAARELSKANLKTLNDNYFGMFDLPRDFRRTFKDMTNDFGMLVIAKNIIRSNDVEDIVYWYKAKLDLPEFKMGSAESWAIAAAHADESDPEDQQRRDEELVREKVAEALAAKQPLHEVVRCDTRGRPIKPGSRRRKTRSSRRSRRSRGHHVSSVPQTTRFDRGWSTADYASSSCAPNSMFGF